MNPEKPACLALTDPDHLKAAAEYLLQVARSSEGRRCRKQPKIDALRQYKEEFLEAHRWAASATVRSDPTSSRGRGNYVGQVGDS
jgi:hypothetical protein